MSAQLWKVASDINDTHAPHNVYEEFYLEGPEINLEPTDRLREPGPLTAIAEALNAAPLLKEALEYCVRELESLIEGEHDDPSVGIVGWNSIHEKVAQYKELLTKLNP